MDLKLKGKRAFVSASTAGICQFNDRSERDNQDEPIIVPKERIEGPVVICTPGVQRMTEVVK